MSNVYSYQVLKDDTQTAVIKITASFDGTGQESNISRIQANSLYGALNTANTLLSGGGTAKSYYGLQLNRLWYDVDTSVGDVQLYWANTLTASVSSGTPLFFMQGNGEFDGQGNWITVKNTNVGPGYNGDIGIVTRGQTANASYTILLEFRKDNAHYQRGQFNDPAAFNYPPYGLTP